MYSSDSYKVQDYRSLVAFLHCFTVCDTVSGFAGNVKKTAVDALMKIANLADLIKPLYEQNSDPQRIARNLT